MYVCMYACLLSIRISLACARASKLTTTNMYVCMNAFMHMHACLYMHVCVYVRHYSILINTKDQAVLCMVVINCVNLFP